MGKQIWQEAMHVNQAYKKNVYIIIQTDQLPWPPGLFLMPWPSNNT